MATTSAEVTTVNHENRVEEVYQRAALCKIKTGMSYRAIAQEVGISKNIMEKLTGKSRRMTEENLNKLVTYLESMGF